MGFRSSRRSPDFRRAELSRLAGLSRLTEPAEESSTSLRFRLPPNERFVVTAEIPVISHIAYPDQLRSAATPRPRERSLGELTLLRRRGAPLALRVVVVALFLVGLTSVVGVVAERIHPTWFESLRNVVVIQNSQKSTEPRPQVRRERLALGSPLVV